MVLATVLTGTGLFWGVMGLLISEGPSPEDIEGGPLGWLGEPDAWQWDLFLGSGLAASAALFSTAVFVLLDMPRAVTGAAVAWLVTIALFTSLTMQVLTDQGEPEFLTPLGLTALLTSVAVLATRRPLTAQVGIGLVIAGLGGVLALCHQFGSLGDAGGVIGWGLVVLGFAGTLLLAWAQGSGREG